MSRQYLAHRGANNAEFTFKASSEWPWPFYMGLSVMAGFRSILATFRRSVLVFWLFLAIPFFGRPRFLAAVPEKDQ